MFLLLYCDNYWPLQLDRLWTAWRAGEASAQITVYDNSDGASRDNVIVGTDGLVEMIDSSRSHPGLKGIEIGYAILAKSAILPLLTRRDQPFERAVYPALIAQRQLRAYRSRHRYYSIGSLDRLDRTAAFLARRPAVIMARDGRFDSAGACAGLRRFAEADCRVIVVGDQSSDPRPHLPVGGRPELLAEMLFRAQREHDLDLTLTPFIGAGPAHAAAAEIAGCPFWLREAGTPLEPIARRLIDRLAAAPDGWWIPE